MDKTLIVDTNFLYKEKERINEMIEKSFHEKEFQEKLKIFENQHPYNDDNNVITKILIDIGRVLYKFTKPYFDAKDEAFVYYFWPGFSTMQNKRISIWGSETGRDEQPRYTTGIGWDENGNEFRNCPTTLAYDQVLNNENFTNCDYFAGSTHAFRVNQKKGNKDIGTYLKLRVNKEFVFKVLHVTTNGQIQTEEQDNNSKYEKTSPHTLHISLSQSNMTESGINLRNELKIFLNENAVREKKRYLWEWPFNVLPFEEGKIEPENIIDFCIKKQESDIDIQTHLYSYWIAETFGNGRAESVFVDVKSKMAYEQELNKLLENRKNNKLKEKLSGFFDKIDVAKNRVKRYGKPENYYKEQYFTHWYTLYHEGVTVNEDLGSTMFLTNRELPLELQYHVATWIEDIYNNLKLVESKAIAERDRFLVDFNNLYHMQMNYIDLFKFCIEKDNKPHDLLPIIEYLRFSLKIARNYYNSDKLKEDLIYKRPIEVSKVIEESHDIINILRKNNSIESRFLGIKPEQERKILAELDQIITIENIHSVYVYTHKEAFEMIIHELLFNAIKHSILDNNLNIRIVFESLNELKQTISFYNNSKKSYTTKKEFFAVLDKTERLGIKITKKIAKALDIDISYNIDNNKICATLTFNKHESK